jgi:uncharacterized protein YjiS (DUF1127 family)
MRIPAFIHLPTDATQAETPAASPAPGLLRGLAAILAFLRAWRAERRTLALIAQMDAATLKDIGADAWALRQHLRDAHDPRAAFLRAWRGE